MQVEVKLLFSSPAEAAAFLAADPVDIRYAVTKSVDSGPLNDIHAAAWAAFNAEFFLAADPVDIRYAVTKSVDSGPLNDIHGPIASEAPGKPSAAPTARSPRTAAAAPSTPAPSAAAPAPAPTATPPAAAAPSASAPAEAAFDYAVLAKAVNAAVPKHGKDTLLAIATKHGAANFKALKPEAWKAAYDDVVALGA